MATKLHSMKLPRIAMALVPYSLQLAFFGIMAALVAANVEG